MVKKYLRWIIVIVLLAAVGYGAGRLYYRVTGGFRMGNIVSTLPYDSQWTTRPLNAVERKKVDELLSQKFTYLGKGCQSYVFLSADDQHVLKFFKYQRFRVQPWVDLFSFIPPVDRYRQKKLEKKQNKLAGFYRSWKIAFDDLQPETGLVYVHLNKSNDLHRTLVFYDKMGLEQRIEADEVEFLLQRKATMLCPTIDELMKKGDVDGAKRLLLRITALVLSENKRGYGDNDHALMQNTGVLDGYPVHIDVGQFIKNEKYKRPEVYRQELFSKTYKFLRWLKKHHPELGAYYEQELRGVIGEQYSQMKPHFKRHS